MGCRIIKGRLSGYDRGVDVAVMYDSVTDTAFGPVVYDDNDRSAAEIIEDFLQFLASYTPPADDLVRIGDAPHHDPRSYTQRGLNRAWGNFWAVKDPA